MHLKAIKVGRWITHDMSPRIRRTILSALFDL